MCDYKCTKFGQNTLNGRRGRLHTAGKNNRASLVHGTVIIIRQSSSWFNGLLAALKLHNFIAFFYASVRDVRSDYFVVNLHKSVQK